MVPKPECPDAHQRNRVLEERIETLERENSKLRDENLLLKARLVPSRDGTPANDGEKTVRPWYRNLFECHPLPLYIFDPGTLRILLVNEAAVGHYGYTKEEFEGLRILDITPEEDIPKVLNAIRSSRSPLEKPGLFRQRKKDGTIITVDIHSHQIDFDGRQARLSMCLDVTDRIRAHKDLMQSEEKFRMAFMISPDAVNINRLEDGLYYDINEGFLKTTGYSREEVIGKTSLDLKIWVDPGDRETLTRTLREKGQVNNFEALFRMKDGTVREGLMSAKIMTLDDTPYILNITRDITEMKIAQARVQASLQEKEILLKEINHRVKNNLQVVLSLLSLQASYIQDPGYKEKFRESQNRVRAIAIMHEETCRGQDLAGVDFSSCVRKLVEDLAHSYHKPSRDIALKLDLGDVRLVLDTAIPCSLIITELVSNAMKHAFGDRREGVIEVRLRNSPSGEYFLQVSDNGEGFPEDLDFRNTRTMGLQFVHQMAAQLGSKLAMERQNGTNFSMFFREYHEVGTQVY
ncbi:MAG: PAS domain S-box protein [Proteobacteria bacterium]|nr:PAS domain S-box protein [Pseudomonadota bacterium]